MTDPDFIKNNFPLLLALGGLSGAVFSLWGNIKLIVQSVLNLFIVQWRIEDFDISRSLIRHVQRDGKIFVLGWKTINSNMVYAKDGSLRDVAFSDLLRVPLLAIYKKKPIFFVIGGAKNDSPGGNKYTMIYLRGTVNLDQLVREASDRDFEIRDKAMFYGALGSVNEVRRFAVHRIFYSYQGGNGKPGEILPQRVSEVANSGWSSILDPRFPIELIGWKREEFGPKKVSATDQLYLSPKIRHGIDEIRFWKSNSEWFKKRNVPWRMGVMMHGLPGCGKSSVARYIAEDLDLPVYVFDLSAMSNKFFSEMWRKCVLDAPCMVLLEDIDAVFDGRNNLTKNLLDDKLTFDCLLNCIDGIEKSDGVLLVITTNNPSKVDAALATVGSECPTRPGRIDLIMEFGLLDEEGRRMIARRVFCDNPDSPEVDALVMAGDGDTGAQFQLRCVKKAQEIFFEHKVLRMPARESKIAADKNEAVS